MKSLDKKKTKELECNCIMSGYAQTTNFCPVHKDLSMKPKELEWEKTLHIEMVLTVADSLTAGKIRPFGSDKSDITIKHFKKIKKLISSILQKQRTELLEKIKNYFRYKRFGCTDESGKIMADFVLDVVKQEVINLLNKKDE